VVKKREIVVITGASAGVGRAAVREFASRGADVALLARGRDGLEAAAREVESLGGRALALEVDVADAAAVERAADTVERELGPIDIWVNNAMTSVFAPIKQTRAEEFHRVTEVTYLGFVYGTLAALKYMLPRDRGAIVHVGSALAYRSIPLQAAYCASKHAILGFFAALRTELLHDGSGVKTTMVQMPALNTPQFGWVRSRLPRKAQPVPPIYQPEVAARLIWKAAHRPGKREWYGAWSVVKAVVGNKVAPWFADRYLAKNGYDAQQYDGRKEPGRPDNLYQPVAGDHGAHGAFDDRARSWSVEAWAEEHAGLLAAALCVGAAAVAGSIGVGRLRARNEEAETEMRKAA